MEIIKLDESNIVKEITSFVVNQKEGIVYGIPKCTSVFCGINNELNADYCKKNNIQLLQFPNEGGVIVVSEGDFDIGHFSYNVKNTFNKDFANCIIKYLTQLGLNAQFKGNDLILDDLYKCGSYSSRQYGKILYSAFHISININLEAIKNICKKEMIKIPKGLSEYNISTNNIQELFLEFLKQGE